VRTRVKGSYFFECEAGELTLADHLVLTVTPEQIVEDLFKVRIKAIFNEWGLPQRVLFLQL
jgi:hypothetical protein